MQSRSGSSMVAGIFAAHGFWNGESYDGVGYETYENVQVKDVIRENKHRLTRGEFVEPFDIEFEPEREPWFWKGPVEFYPCFQHLDPVVILVRRDIEATARSVLARHPYGEIEYARKLAIQRHNLMNQVDGINVYSDELIAGDYSSIKHAIYACGVDFSRELADQVIQPKLWHH
jgi:hypothetical protein